MTERPSIQTEIHRLLQKAEVAGEAVKDLARACLKQFRTDCGGACEAYQKAMMEVLSSGSRHGLEDLAIERDERIDQARTALKTRLEKLLKTAAEQGLG